MDQRTGVSPGLKVMVDRATRWKFAWQQSPLAACPQEVKDGVEDGTKVGGARSPARSPPPEEPAQQEPTPRRSGRCRRIECSSYGPFDPDRRSFKTDVNFSNTLSRGTACHSQSTNFARCPPFRSSRMVLCRHGRSVPRSGSRLQALFAQAILTVTCRRARAPGDRPGPGLALCRRVP